MSVSPDFRHSDGAVRLRAIAELAGERPVSPGEAQELLRLLGDADKRVQRAAAEALAVQAGALADFDRWMEQALAAGDRRLRWGAAYCQARAGRPTETTLAIWIETLASRDRDLRWAARDLIVESAAELGASVLAALCVAAGDSDPQRRKMALYGIRDVAIADGESAAIALAALDDSHFEVRLAALSAIPVVCADLEEAARSVGRYLSDADPRMRRATAAALGKLGAVDPGVTEALENALGSEDAALRRAAGRALGRE